MARVKRAINAHKKRRVVLERASGYRGQRSRLYRKAKEQMLHSMTYAYRDRKDRKGDFRRLWIQRINAAARSQRHDLQPFHPGPQGGGRRSRPQHAGRAGRGRRRRVRRAGRGGEGGPAGTTRGARVPLPDGTLRVHQRPLTAAQGRATADQRAFRQRARAFLVEGPQAVTRGTPLPAPRSPSCSSPPRRGPGTRIWLPRMARAGHSGAHGQRRGDGRTGRDGHPAGAARRLRLRRRPAGAGHRRSPARPRPGASPRLVALLASVRDPGNAGTVLRTADAAGAEAVVFSDASVDPYNGKCVRASGGQPVPPAARGRRPGRPRGQPRCAVPGCGSSPPTARGGRTLDELTPAELAAPTAWIFGNEAWGMPAALLALADEVSRCPSTAGPRA